MCGETYNLKWTPNDRFFENHFMVIVFTLTEILPEDCWRDYLNKIIINNKNSEPGFQLQSRG